MHRDALLRLGDLLYGGDRWGAQLAADLTALGEGKPDARKVSQSQVSTWVNGAAGIPGWAVPLARALAVKGQVDLARRSAALAELVADPEALAAPARRSSRLDRLRQPHPDDRPEEPGPPEEPTPEPPPASHEDTAMTDRSTLCDRIRRAPNADLANRLADLIQGDVARPAFIQRIGTRWALMAGGDNILFEGDFWDMRDRLASVLDD